MRINLIQFESIIIDFLCFVIAEKTSIYVQHHMKPNINIIWL